MQLHSADLISDEILGEFKLLCNKEKVLYNIVDEEGNSFGTVTMSKEMAISMNIKDGIPTKYGYTYKK